MTVPTSEILYSVLEKSLENPKPYIDKLKSDLNNINPFSSTTSSVFTDPKATTATRSAATRTKSMFGIAGAGVVMSVILSIFVCVARRRNMDDTDDDECNERFSKHIYGDTTVAGDTFIIEKNDDTHDGIISILTSTETKDLSEKSKTVSHYHDDGQRSNVIRAHRKPRTVAEIESLLMLGGGDII